MSGTNFMASASGNNRAYVTPFGTQAVTLPGSILLSDSMSGATLDTTYRWQSPVLAGGGTVTQANSSLALVSGTTANNAAAVSSIDKIEPIGAGFLAVGAPIIMEAGVGLNTHRFFGIGTPNGSFTAATPLSDAYGWEVDITGRLNCVTYASTVRTVWRSIPVPTDGLPHIYGLQIRADAVYFLYDNLEDAIAVGGYQGASVNNLPVRIHIINHTTGPTNSASWTTFGVAAIDLTSNYVGAYNGQMIQPTRIPGKVVNLTAASIAAEATIWTPAAGRRFRLMGGLLTSGTTTANVTLKDNTAGTTILVLPFGAAAVPMPFTIPGNGILSTAANNVLTATGVATQTLSGYVYGCEE